jgi:hypothetical protein
MPTNFTNLPGCLARLVRRSQEGEGGQVGPKIGTQFAKPKTDVQERVPTGSQRSPHRCQMAFHLGHAKVVLFSAPDHNAGSKDIDEGECSQPRNRWGVDVGVFQGFDQQNHCTMIHQGTLLAHDPNNRRATGKSGLRCFDHSFGLARIRNRNYDIPAFHHRCGNELLMRVTVGRAWYAKKREFLLGIQRHYSRCPKTEEFNSLCRQQQVDCLLERALIQLLPRPVQTVHAVVENLIRDDLWGIRGQNHGVSSWHAESDALGQAYLKVLKSDKPESLAKTNYCRFAHSGASGRLVNRPIQYKLRRC